MKKRIYNIPIPFIYEPSHKGAPYTINGVKWMNHGELIEIIIKSVYGFTPVKDGNTRFDIDSDIPSMQASIKSGKATLTSVYLASTFEKTIQEYFKRTASNIWIFGIVMDDRIICYTMDRKEFEQFTKAFAYFTKEKTIRYKQVSTKMIEWMDERTEG